MKQNKFIISLFFIVLTGVILVLGCPVTVDPPDDQTVTQLTITGFLAPIKGATPITSIDASQYSGTIVWSPLVTGTFAASTEYTATITLTPKPGYTFSGVQANSFSVSGASSVINSSDSGIITAVFPKTLFSLNMIEVPAGRFQRDGMPANISEVDAFHISQYEITREQFFTIMGVDPSNVAYSSGISDPVQQVNWYQAIAFCNKLSIAEGLSPVYAVSGVDFSTFPYSSIPTENNDDWNTVTATWSNNGYRLPTEMEWMLAAMGAPADGQEGSTNTSGYNKAFAGSTGSNVIGDYAVFGYNMAFIGATTTERTNPVGSKLPNELYLYEMSGNVNELCWDWQEISPVGTLSNYREPNTGTSRMICSGRWNGMPDYCILGYRGSSTQPSDTNKALGFRVARN